MTIWCHALPPLSCPTPIGHLTFPLVMPDRIIVMPDLDRASHFSPCHARPSPCHARPSLTSCPFLFLVMPDPDRASLPHQIAGQAGNDGMVPCTSFFSLVLPFPPLSSCPTPIGHLSPTRLPVERLPVKPAMTIWYHALPSSPSCLTPLSSSCPSCSRHARPRSGISLFPSSCPTPIGHLRLPVERLPVKPAMTICGTGNDDSTRQ